MPLDRLQKICYSLIIILISGYILHIGSPIIIPIIFAVLVGVFLNPLDNKIRPIVKIKWLSIVLCFLAMIIPFVLITTVFSFQLINIFESLPSISENLSDGLDKLVKTVNKKIPSVELTTDTLMEKSEDSDMKGPLKLIAQGVASTSTIIASTGLVFIFSFLLMYYKSSFKRFIIQSFEKSSRPDIKETLKKIKDTIQSYIGGLGLVIVILSTLNTIGLTLIGIEHAIFWGCLAGALAIIPYIGTMLGGLLPFIFALSSAEASWQPYAVIVYYLIIQQIEGNFITPKIVGDKVDINPLFALIAILFFASYWGIAGVILALPLISILKIILAQFKQTENLSILMSSDISGLVESKVTP